LANRRVKIARPDFFSIFDGVFRVSVRVNHHSRCETIPFACQGGRLTAVESPWPSHVTHVKAPPAAVG
jgi:hypothetical protein